MINCPSLFLFFIHMQMHSQIKSYLCGYLYIGKGWDTARAKWGGDMCR